MPRLAFIRSRVALPRLPLRKLLLPVEGGQPIPPGFAQQLVVIAQAIGIHSVAHRATRLVAVAAIAEAALPRK